MALVSANESRWESNPHLRLFFQLNYMTHSPESELFRMLCSGYSIAPVRSLTRNESKERQELGRIRTCISGLTGNCAHSLGSATDSVLPFELRFQIISIMFIEKDAHCSEIRINSPTTSKNYDLLVKVASMRLSSRI